MAITCKFNPQDLRYMFLEGPKEEMKILLAHFNKIPEYQFLPSFAGRQKRPEVFISEMTVRFRTVYYTYIGMWGEIYQYCKKKGIVIHGLEAKYFKRDTGESFEQFKERVNSWGLNITPRPYQLEAAWKILSYRQSCSQIATRAGKTLICYLIMRYIMETEREHGRPDPNFLMIVPSIQLVKQGVNDFSSYGEFFKTEAIWAKGEYVESANLTIGTFQSLIKKLDKRSKKKYDPQWFDKFSVVVLDECHKGSASEIKKICTQPFMNNTIIKYGFTGTLPLDNTIERFAIHTLFGPKIQDITAAELIENGYITPIEVKQITIDHNSFIKPADYEKLLVREAEYLLSDYVTDDNGSKIKDPEGELLRQHKKVLPIPMQDIRRKLYELGDSRQRAEYCTYLMDMLMAEGHLLNFENAVAQYLDIRIDILTNLLRWEINRNCLILFHYKEYAKKVYEILKAKFPNRPVLLATGSVTPKKRSEVQEVFKNSEDAIMVASYGIMSTGITLPNIHFGVHFESFESHIVNQQSLGRGLGKADDKDVYIVYDFIDVLPSGRIASQGNKKRKIYKQQKFPCQVIKIDVKTKTALIEKT